MRTHVRYYFILYISLCFCLSGFAATNQFSVVNNGNIAYTINGVDNPNLTLVRGFTYTFNVNAPNHPFLIKDVQGTGTGDTYSDGVTGNGTQTGTVTFSVPNNAPDQLFYNCQFHEFMTGELNIVNPPIVYITQFHILTDIGMQFIGTDALNYKIQYSTNLVSGSWLDADFIHIDYTAGEFTSVVMMPAADAANFRIVQGFF